MPQIMIALIPYINLLNLSWINISIFEEYGAFNDLFLGLCLKHVMYVTSCLLLFHRVELFK